MATPYKLVNVEAGKRLKYIRKEVLKMNDTRDLADRIKWSHSSIVNYETGKTEMGVDFLFTLYAKFGIQPNYIITGALPYKIEQKPTTPQA